MSSNVRVSRWIVAALIFPASAAIAPAVASATTARVEGGVIVVEDTQGIADRLTVSAAGSNQFGPTIRIDGAAPGDGCIPAAGGEAFCPDGTGSDGTGTPNSMRFVLGGGADTVSLQRTIDTGLDAVDVSFDTGPAKDEVELRACGRFQISTGDDDDVVSFRGVVCGQEEATVDAGAANDKVELAGNQNVGDTVDGGPGVSDRVSYAGRGAALTIISDPTQSSGSSGEDDHLSNFEILQGGSGPDTITGGAGNDTLEGGSGLDTLTAGAGTDLLVGGPSAGDILLGEGGNDTLKTEDGLKDARANCGLDGSDTAIIDSVDPDPNFVNKGGTFFNPILKPILGGSRNCEKVARQPRGQSPLVALTRAHASGAVSVHASCERPGGCHGTLRVLGRRSLSDPEPLDLAKGQSRTYHLLLNVGKLPRGARVVAHGRDRKGRELESSVVVRKR
jgi:hemolysin type calcium-binding protein